MERPILRQLYKHFQGDVVMVLGIAKDKTRGSDKEVVVCTNLQDGLLYTWDLDGFFAIHPKLQVPRFQLVTIKKDDVR